LIGVTGSTRSGKGTLSDHLRIYLDTEVVCLDFFFNTSRISNELGGNWETPKAIDWDNFYQKIQD
jgi:uridine kinase